MICILCSGTQFVPIAHEKPGAQHCQNCGAIMWPGQPKQGLTLDHLQNLAESAAEAREQAASLADQHADSQGGRTRHRGAL